MSTRKHPGICRRTVAAAGAHGVGCDGIHPPAARGWQESGMGRVSARVISEIEF